MPYINLNHNITFAVTAGEPSPLVERYGASLRWVLDVAASALPEERSAIARLRRSVDPIGARRGAQISARDLKIAIGGVFEALERDLGPTRRRPEFSVPRADRSSRTHSPPSRFTDSAEWGLARASPRRG